jgi:hypothetical protein
MAQERIHLDVSDQPALRELVEEVRANGVPVVLQIEREDVAVISPSKKWKKKRSGVLKPDDPLFDLIGIGRSGIPGGVSGRKHEALLWAKRQHY